ncbi:hypothetical protein BMS3Abin05_00764 [bacterium BMS3Abin05]|nr:hypothetical protein BMS3Abin05_00764 [bacterium BMS3Abin05]GBE26168.1 hypothetical protein BMS3Bbin03_00079 [bacterium BMS3Bbin03]
MITGNYRGVVTSGSTVDMGYDCNHGGYNSIYNNSSYEIYESNGLIYAQNNWWGFPGIPWGDFYQGGTILCWCYLNSNPNLSKPMGDFPNKTAYYPEIKQLIYGINLRKEGNYVSAYNLMKNLFSEYYNSIYAPYILMEIHKTYWKAKVANSIIKESSYLNYLSSIETEYGLASQKFNNEAYAKALQLEASELIRTRHWIAAKEKLTQIKETFSNSAAEEEALFDLIMVYSEGFNNEETAHSMLALLEGKYPESIFILHGKVAVGEALTSKQLRRHWQPFSKGFWVEMPIVENFTLFSAYPNPFNPTTTIVYQLPQTAYVTVAIYDVRGRLVETLVNGEKAAGQYSVQWHAEGVPSGVYFYRIHAGKFTATKKLLLLK